MVALIIVESGCKTEFHYNFLYKVSTMVSTVFILVVLALKHQVK